MEHGLSSNANYDKQITLIEHSNGIILKIRERELMLLENLNSFFLFNTLIYHKNLENKEKFIGEISILDQYKKINIIFYNKKNNRFGEMSKIAMRCFLHCFFSYKKKL